MMSQQKKKKVGNLMKKSQFPLTIPQRSEPDGPEVEHD